MDLDDTWFNFIGFTCCVAIETDQKINEEASANSLHFPYRVSIEPDLGECTSTSLQRLLQLLGSFHDMLLGQFSGCHSDFIIVLLVYCLVQRLLLD